MKKQKLFLSTKTHKKALVLFEVLISLVLVSLLVGLSLNLPKDFNTKEAKLSSLVAKINKQDFSLCSRIKSNLKLPHQKTFFLNTYTCKSQNIVFSYQVLDASSK